MARRKDGPDGIGIECNRCSWEWCRKYVADRLRVVEPHADDVRVKCLADRLKEHHWLTFPSQNELAGHMESVFGERAKETGSIKATCGWWLNKHEHYSQKADSNGAPMSVADAFLGERYVKLLGLKEHRGVVMLTPTPRPEAMPGEMFGKAQP